MATPNARLIVRSFLNFLQSVECSDDKSESLKVATDCLKTAFSLHSPSTDEAAALPEGLLLDLFSSWKAEQVERSPLPSDEEEVSAEDLLERLYDAFLLRFRAKEDPKANQLFNEALSDCCFKIENSDETADYLKSRGNHAMQAKLYAQAAELYTEAISLCQENAFYFATGKKAAAYIKLKKNAEAIKDCLKAIKIDPKYSKAYSRLGSAYFALGNYNAALDKGFLRALELDPDNQTIQENVEMTRSKMNEERQANIRALCNPGRVASFSSGSNAVNPDFLSDYIKGLVHLSHQRTRSEDPIKELTDAFLQKRGQSNKDSSDSSEEEDESDDLPNVNMSDVFLSASSETLMAQLVKDQ